MRPTLNHSPNVQAKFDVLFWDILLDQRPDGSWDWVKMLSVAPTMALNRKLDLDDLNSMNCAGARPELYLRAWSTAIVVYWLEARGGHVKTEWSGQVAKAKHWLRRCAPRQPFGRNWSECVSRYMQALGA